jgi:hypothetical protein
MIVRALILSQQAEISMLRNAKKQICLHVTALASKLFSLQERIGRNSCNLTKAPLQ